MQNPTAVPIDGTDIVRIVVGEDRLDVYNAPALRDLSVQLVSELKYRQILDLEGVYDADSTSLGVMVGADRRAHGGGGALVLFNVGANLAHTLSITSLDKTLIIASDLESAVAFFNPLPAEYEDDPEPTPANGEHGTYATCSEPIHYIDCPHGGWWNHDVQPADGHDAEIGGPA